MRYGSRHLLGLVCNIAVAGTAYLFEGHPPWFGMLSSTSLFVSMDGDKAGGLVRYLLLRHMLMKVLRYSSDILLNICDIWTSVKLMNDTSMLAFECSLISVSSAMIRVIRYARVSALFSLILYFHSDMEYVRPCSFAPAPSPPFSYSRSARYIAVCTLTTSRR